MDIIKAKALFPISLNNQIFSTERVINAINNITTNYDSMTFIIADQLQLYNKALKIDKNNTLGMILGDFSEKTNYYEERKKWIDRLKVKVNDSVCKEWDIISVNDIADNKTYNILRNILLAYYSVDDFKNDIKHYASEFAHKKNTNYNFDKAMSLARGYLLEEFALSIRLKVINEIVDEFYLGEQAFPLTNLYSGKYNFSVYDIAEVSDKKLWFKFYKYDELNSVWNCV